MIMNQENSTLIVMTDQFKQALRLTNQYIRKHLSPSYQQKISSKICSQIRTLEEYRYAKRIALYQAMNGEIDLGDLWRTAPLQGKYCYFPVINKDETLSFMPATPSTLFLKNKYGIQEPEVHRKQVLAPSQIDLMFIPLVAVDERGTRIGMGAGYYDKTLAVSRPPLLVGVAYNFQRQPFIKAENWDIPLNLVITECGIYWSRQN